MDIKNQLADLLAEGSATLKDRGTPDESCWNSIARLCVESRGRGSPHREQSKIDTSVLRLQFDYGYMGDGGFLLITCFLVGADTSSGQNATIVPDSKKMNVPYVVAATAKWVRDLGCERFYLHGDT